jgi:hypothetical protein
MRNGIDLIELYSNHTRQKRSRCVEDHTTTLYNIHGLILAESFSYPSRSVRMRVVIAVKDGDYVSLDIERQEVVDVVYLGFRVWHLHHAKVRIESYKVMQLFLQLWHRLWRVVDNVDTESICRIDNPLNSVESLIYDNGLLIW